MGSTLASGIDMQGDHLSLKNIMSKSFYQFCEAIFVFFKVLTGKGNLLDGKNMILKSNTVTPISYTFGLS